ncbi:MAG: M20/M25/M40 family metallo-hydrolase [Candidatus Tectomicrobia bacterium]|uniref:M20/M25/M40 family metallo-hydrolase n=1 Tax=Tectimicrobiota bacterium TaxID=2528274 RepID=A0A933GK86_UNCTE|nr:M20/M25/M40 family metallo-hydrolase [Candidatus Tectomicrobia bacterium]
MKDFVQQIREIISIDSSGHKGTGGIASYFAPYLEKAGFLVDYQKVLLDHVEQINLIAYRWPPSKENQGLILHTHLDTVPPAPANFWTETKGDPFRATLQGDKVFGLGSADVKLDFLCKVLAASTHSHKELKHPLTLVGSFGEESGLLGAKHLLQNEASAARPLPGPYVLVGEPTNLALAVAHKGYMVVILQIRLKEDLSNLSIRKAPIEEPLMEVEFEGREAHSSTPNLGDNAIEKNLKFLSIYQSACGRLIEISGGRQHNIIPGKCKLVFSSKEADQLEGLMLREGLKYKFLKNMVKNRNKSANFPLSENDNHLLKMTMLFFEHWQAFKEALSSEIDPKFDPPFATANLGKISASMGKIEIVLDLRTLPAQNPGTLAENMGEFCQKIKQNYPHYQADVVVSHENPPYQLQQNSRLLNESRKTLQNILGRVELIYKATSTEAGIYAKAGFEPLIFGPGPSVGNVHAPNEHNLLSHLNVAMAFYEEIISRFCL